MTVLFSVADAVPVPSRVVLLLRSLLTTRKAEPGSSRPLHSRTCSRIFSLGCRGRSVETPNHGQSEGPTGAFRSRSFLQPDPASDLLALRYEYLILSSSQRIKVLNAKRQSYPRIH